VTDFEERFVDSPLHLVLLLCSFALTAYAGIRLLEGDTLGIVLWLVGAAVLHDLVLLPLYSLIDRGAQAALRRRTGTSPVVDAERGWINYVRVPAFVSGVLLLVWFPLILDQVDDYEALTGLPGGTFLAPWLLITAALFAASAVWLVVSARCRGRRGCRPVRRGRCSRSSRRPSGSRPRGR
jgi:hypothetical protein